MMTEVLALAWRIEIGTYPNGACAMKHRWARRILKVSLSWYARIVTSSFDDVSRNVVSCAKKPTFTSRQWNLKTYWATVSRAPGMSRTSFSGSRRKNIPSRKRIWNSCTPTDGASILARRNGDGVSRSHGSVVRMTARVFTVVGCDRDENEVVWINSEMMVWPLKQIEHVWEPSRAYHSRFCANLCASTGVRFEFRQVLLLIIKVT